MHCNDANILLVEYASRELPDELQTEVHTHLADCEACQADLAIISQQQIQLQTMANHWHDETPPMWDPKLATAKGTRSHSGFANNWLDNFRLWFPTFASATALVLVAVIYLQPNTPNGVLPNGQGVTQDYANLPQLPQGEATKAALVQSVLESSEEQRAQELQALLKVLKAEMDRRSIETEESLRYIITHQIQGQQEIEQLYEQVEALMTAENTDANTTVQP